MSLSTRELHLIAEELRTLLTRGVVRHIAATATRAFNLELRLPRHNRWLHVELTPQQTRAHLTEARPQQLPSPTPFVMLLRKHLEGMTLQDLHALPDDRVLRLDLARRPADPPDERLLQATLLLELSGRHANALLLGPDDRILGMAAPDRSTLRPLRVGAAWTPPPLPDRPLPAAARDRLRLADLPPDGARSRAADAHYLALEQARALDAELHAALKRLRERHDLLQRRVEHLEADLQRALDAERFKRWGELLRGAWGQVPRGAAQAQVTDYYDPDLQLTTVPLDPALDLGANIERYFKRYRRYHGAIDAIEERLLHHMERLDAFAPHLQRAEALASQARDTADPTPLRDLLRDLEAADLLPPPRPPQPRHRDDDAPALPYRAFTSRANKPILVGKGPRQNDQLTLRVARGRDIWLHARDTPGAHVLVRLEKNQSIDHETLLDAATLAAHYSKAHNDTLIDVTWTEARYVRKPKGYPPGLVTVAQGHTLTVRIDPDRLQRLLQRE